MYTEHAAYPSQAHPFQVEFEGLLSKSYVVAQGPMLLGEVALTLLTPQPLVAAFVVQSCFDHRAGLPAVGAFGPFLFFHSSILLLDCHFRHSLISRALHPAIPYVIIVFVPKIERI